MRFYFDIDDAELESVRELIRQMRDHSIDVLEWRDQLCEQVDNLIYSNNCEISRQIIGLLTESILNDEKAKDLGSE